MAFNVANLTPSYQVNNNQGDYRVWDYTTTDTIATVETAPLGSYFNGGADKNFRTIDIIKVTASDANRVYFLNSVALASGTSSVSMTKIVADVDTF